MCNGKGHVTYDSTLVTCNESSSWYMEFLLMRASQAPIASSCASSNFYKPCVTYDPLCDITVYCDRSFQEGDSTCLWNVELPCFNLLRI